MINPALVSVFGLFRHAVGREVASCSRRHPDFDHAYLDYFADLSCQTLLVDTFPFDSRGRSSEVESRMAQSSRG